MKKPLLLLTIIFTSIFLFSSNVEVAQPYSNGGYSADPSNPDYGTHDWIAQHALDWLPTQEKKYILDNLAAYLYGTELPDNNVASAPGHIGDNTKHHIYYWANGTLQDDVAADRAAAEYQTALNLLNAGNSSGAALTAGIMSHYIAEVAVFAHVMGSGTDWGAETGNNHPNYENYVDTRTNTHIDTYNTYLAFDETLQIISAYNAAIGLAFDTTFDQGGVYTCVWMNNNYDTSNPNSPYWIRAGESLNLAVNALADVLHTLYVNSNHQASTLPLSSIQNLVVQAAANQAYFVYADPYRMSRAVATYDVASGSIVYGMCQNTQNQDFDNNPLTISQSLADKGRLLLANKAVLMFGSRNPHFGVRYLEDNRLTPIYFQNDGSNIKLTETATGTDKVNRALSSIDFEHEDYFVIMALTDANDNSVFINYGFEWKGTWAAGMYLKAIYPNIQTYTNSYYIIHWQDTNNDGIPQTNEMTPIPA